MNSELIHKLAATSKEARKILEEKYSHEFRKSGWYVNSDWPEWLMYLDFENSKCYGFDYNKEWYSDNEPKTDPRDLAAPPELVEQRLIEEAKKRGLYVGGEYLEYILSADVQQDGSLKVNKRHFYSTEANTLSIDDCIVFKQWKWAESMSNINAKQQKITDCVNSVRLITDQLIEALTELKNQLP